MCLKYVASDLYNHSTIWWKSVYHITFFISLSLVESTCFSFSLGEGQITEWLYNRPANALQINAHENSKNHSLSEKYDKEH